MIAKFAFRKLGNYSHRSRKYYSSVHSHVFSLSTLSHVIQDRTAKEQAMNAIDTCPDLLAIARNSNLIATSSASTNSSLGYLTDDMKKYIATMIRYFRRIMAYLFYGTPLLALAPATLTFGSYFPWLEDVVWDYCLWSVLQLGPTFIKLAQWASTRPDLFPPKLVARLQSLQDNVTVPYKFDVVEKTMREAFGENWKDKLEIDPKPIGAGCVAQVFKGKLLNSPDKKSSDKVTEVAIKMIHPHIEGIVATDMELLSMFARWLDTFPSLEMLSLGDTLGEFGEMMKKQLDLRYEAKNLRTFIKKFKDDKWALFPAPIEGFVKKNILVETLMEGSSIVNYMSLQSDENQLVEGNIDPVTKLKLKLSDLGCRLILKMVFFDNFIHGDLHPGNIMVHFDKSGEPHLVILDCGIVYQSKSEEDFKRMVDLSFAFLKHDGRTAGRLMVDFSRVRGNAKQAENFCEAVQKMIDDAENESYFEHLGEYISRLCELARVNMVKLEPGYFAIAMALKVVEGVSLALNKDIDMVSKCIPIIIKTRTMRALGIEKFPMPEQEEFEKELVEASKIAQAKRSMKK